MSDQLSRAAKLLIKSIDRDEPSGLISLATIDAKEKLRRALMQNEGE